MSLLNTMTSDEWKRLRTDAGIEKTPWYKGVGPSVGSKLEDWQKARTEAKQLRKNVMLANYVYKKSDAAKIRKAYKCLEELKKALDPMLIKAIAHFPEADKTNKGPQVRAMYNKLLQMKQEANQKLGKWAGTLLQLEALKDGEKQGAVNKLFDDLHID